MFQMVHQKKKKKKSLIGSNGEEAIHYKSIV